MLRQRRRKWFALRGLGNTVLWAAMLVFYVARGALQARRYPANLRASFAPLVVRF